MQHIALSGRCGPPVRRTVVDDLNRTAGGVVDVEHSGRGGAGHAFLHTQVVGVGHTDRNQVAHLGLPKGQAGACGAINGHPIGQPLVVQGAQSIGIRQVLTGRQDLVLRGGAADGDGTRRRVVGRQRIGRTARERECFDVDELICAVGTRQALDLET